MFQRVCSRLSSNFRWGVSLVLAALLISGSVRAAGEDPPATAPTGPEGCACIGTVGNVNCDYKDEVTVADLALLIDHIFINGTRLPNPAEANINGDPAGEITLGDVYMLIDHLFISRVPLPDCPKPYNNPPDTRFIGFSEYLPFVNSVGPGNWATGVRLNWAANDLVDHAYDDPSFAFEYRLYGPYTDSVYDQIIHSFQFIVFRSYDGQMLKTRQYPLSMYITCDTTWLPGGIRQIDCDTVLVDTIDGTTSFGFFDTLLDVEDPSFLANPEFNRLVPMPRMGDNAWTYAMGDTLYNLFADHPSDTTVRANFIAWVRARDPEDSTVYDPTPAFKRAQVIEPKFERDVAVIDFGSPAYENTAKYSCQLAYWAGAIPLWAAHAGLTSDIQFDKAFDIRDYGSFMQSLYESAETKLLAFALKHKVVIIIQDAAMSGAWSYGGVRQLVLYQAIDVGTNVWVAARVPLGRHESDRPPATDTATWAYQYYFGVQQVAFPGWGSFLYSASHCGLPRTEHFIGANSLDTLRWPNLSIDTALLRTQYKWAGCVPSEACYTDPECNPNNCFPFFPFADSAFAFLGALPQVGWMVRTYDSECMYTFKSLYGAVHPIDPQLSYDGRPVMVRMDRGSFRTVHSLFTPLALEATSGQQLVDSILSWLYEKWLPGNSGPKVKTAVEGRE